MQLRSFFTYSLLSLTGLILAGCATAIQAREVETPIPSKTSQLTPSAIPAPSKSSTLSLSSTPTIGLLPEEVISNSWEQEFSTDFNVHSVPYSQILSGGPRKDGIPAVDDPKFVSVTEADEWLKPVEPIVFVQVGEETRAYPIQILMWHEIVNDTVNDLPLTVTFCPLCNTAIAFQRMIDDRILDFGTTGRLRYSNLIMYDRQTETWWQQANGEAIAGELTGKLLDFYPATIIAWEDFKINYPQGKVLSRETGNSRSYGNNPYAGYDNVNSSPFLYDGPLTPDKLLPMTRVITVDLDDEAVAYPYDVLEDKKVINDRVAGHEIVIFWDSGTASALDAGDVAGGRDVGAATAFSRILDKETLSFSENSGRIIDDQTGSVWNILGQAISGPMAGSQLKPVVSINHFWFSWAAFKPETKVFQP